MVPDIMHDILEGSLELCVRHLLVEYIRERKLFSLTHLNQRIKGFAYGVDTKNKPSELSVIHPDTPLKQSGELISLFSNFFCLSMVCL